MFFKENIGLLIILIVSFVDAARILCLYPAPFHSHEMVFQTLTEALAQQGHEIVVLAPISSEKKVANVTVIDVNKMSYALWEDIPRKKPKKLNTIAVDAETFWDTFDTKMLTIVEAQLNSPEMQYLIKNKTENFDLILVEGCVRPSLIVGARFKAPIIIVSSFYGLADNYHTVGAVVDPIIFPDFNMHQTWNLSLWDKLLSIYTHIRLRLREWKIEKIENAMIRNHFGNNAPTMAELKKNVQMLLLNVHHVWDYNRPVPPNVLYLGALHLRSPKPLHGDIKKFLDNSDHGVIFMSLGSKIKSSNLPSSTINVIMKVFASLPYDFIWKWEAEITPMKVKNVHFKKWLPQADLLFHKKVKAFITHAGLQSTDEAIAARVPMIGLPVRSDQPTNAAKYEQYGIGIRLDIDNLNEDEFRKAIRAVAENPSYRQNIDTLGRIMEEERSGMLEKALRWINHIATDGGHQLRSPLPELSFVEYYLLDVIVAIGLIVLFAISIFIFLSKQAIQLVHKRYCTQKKIKSQ